MVTQEFSDRIALVTGGSRGIGRATALELAKRGAAVAVGYASRKETAEEVTAEIEALGSRAICGPCDLRKQSEIDEFVAKTRTALGPIDLLVNSGAICTVAEHQHVDSQLWLDTIDANLNGAYRILFAVKDEML